MHSAAASVAGASIGPLSTLEISIVEVDDDDILKIILRTNSGRDGASSLYVTLFPSSK